MNESPKIKVGMLIKFISIKKGKNKKSDNIHIKLIFNEWNIFQLRDNPHAVINYKTEIHSNYVSFSDVEVDKCPKLLNEVAYFNDFSPIFNVKAKYFTEIRTNPLWNSLKWPKFKPFFFYIKIWSFFNQRKF